MLYTLSCRFAFIEELAGKEFLLFKYENEYSRNLADITTDINKPFNVFIQINTSNL